MKTNYNCDGAHCTNSIGEVRLLPLGGSANIILCYACYLHEISFRRERNKTLEPSCQFKLPQWEDLEIYTTI